MLKKKPKGQENSNCRGDQNLELKRREENETSRILEETKGGRTKLKDKNAQMKKLKTHEKKLRRLRKPENRRKKRT